MELNLKELVPNDDSALVKLIGKVTKETDFITVSSVPNQQQIKESIDQIYDSNFNELVGAFIDDVLIGYGRIDFHDDISELGIVVEKKYWHFGIGTEIIKFLLSWFKEVSPQAKLYLEVKKENSRAIKLYEYLGFSYVRKTDEAYIYVIKKDDISE